MQFQVPQFIERESKVVGFLTFRQFAYVAAGGVVAFVLYFTAPFAVFLAVSLLAVGIGTALAFVSVGGRSLPSLIVNFLNFSMATKTYIWKKGKAKLQRKPAEYLQPASAEESLPLQVSLKRESKVQNLATKIGAR